MLRIWLVFMLSSYCAWASEGIFADGKVLLNLRYRIEAVDQDGFDRDALASTLRTRLGYETGSWRGLTFLAEAEDISVLGDESYNNTTNDVLDRPVVPDAKNTEVNRIQFRYQNERRSLTVGRQRLIMGNGRFIGNVGWRQNEQTFDAVTWRENFSPKVKLVAAYIHNANRIFGEDHRNDLAADFRQSSFAADLVISGTPVGEVTIFGYFIDLDEFEALAHQNLGLRAVGDSQAGDRFKIHHEVFFIKQDSYADGADRIDYEFLRLALGGKWDAFGLTLAHERLTGDGGTAFIQPLGTLHGPNGWADVFLVVPGDGLVDSHLQFNYRRNDWSATLRYHDFDAEGDIDPRDFGNELNLLLTRKIQKRWQAGVKFADYQGDFGDRTKLWLWAGFQL